MIETREPGPQLPPTGGREAEPMPPALRYRARPGACAVVMVFNGTEHRAVLDLDGRGMARAEDVAKMLRAIARQVERA
jgi:hypothetical protein